MTFRAIPLFLTLLLALGCSGDGSDSSNKEELWEADRTGTAAVNLPSITFDEMKALYESADFIDVIFYNMEFSMSVNNKANIQRMVGFVSTQVAKLNPNCKPTGRIFFQKNGEMMAEADMYFDDVCRYFVFMKNGKATYANDITPEGQAYFNQIFTQVKVEPNQ